jgi:hypothetical protein
MKKDYIKVLPWPASFLPHSNRSKTSHIVLDADAANMYRKWSIKPQSPPKGDFVQIKKLD